MPDYYDVITNPMDLSTMMHKIDLHQYETAKDFMDDIELIVSNCLEYNPDKDPAGRTILIVPNAVLLHHKITACSF